jgi:hypothetical protein
MKKSILNAALLAAALLATPLVAQAIPVTWTLSGVTFGDGGTASGSFDFDASKNDETAYSNVSITTTTVGAFSGSSTYYGAGFNPFVSQMFDPLNNDGHWLSLRFDTALTSFGGTSVLMNEGDFASTERFSADELNPESQLTRYVTAGSVTTLPLVTAVPEPETYALMLAGLAAVGFAAKRRQVL